MTSAHDQAILRGQHAKHRCWTGFLSSCGQRHCKEVLATRYSCGDTRTASWVSLCFLVGARVPSPAEHSPTPIRSILDLRTEVGCVPQSNNGLLKSERSQHEVPQLRVSVITYIHPCLAMYPAGHIHRASGSVLAYDEGPSQDMLINRVVQQGRASSPLLRRTLTSMFRLSIRGRKKDRSVSSTTISREQTLPFVRRSAIRGSEQEIAVAVSDAIGL